MQLRLCSILLWLGCSSTCLAAEIHAQATDVPWKLGQALPEVHLPRISDGAEVKLSDFRGQRVLLIEFASW